MNIVEGVLLPCGHIMVAPNRLGRTTHVCLIPDCGRRFVITHRETWQAEELPSR